MTPRRVIVRLPLVAASAPIESSTFVPSILTREMLSSLNLNIANIAKDVSRKCVSASNLTSEKLGNNSETMRDMCQQTSKETAQLVKDKMSSIKKRTIVYTTC
ncbi:hypothetical protein SAMD00019534_105430 [Acytostelium subglobosum LB1]|uniref:hypothetical protein n=1 Tax=Acytostelium subglobosum LB1 TaxID=1410327 RepID=UPI000644FB32|nr:hypothetical protein SAMD00019534_105430 [Acytostelium subglobosum LB1]GAM27368.1 hypothetical protein SAMD00019534_105430 [Acytostelium subglobosum LB1]|eukprot:XP_012749835.1 hypothetical protein SAMD00019534_105430 [Acytostelium subglobosum LB1]